MNMKFFDNIFEISNDKNYGISGLNKELNAIYVYETFIKENKGLLVLTNSLYEANEFYQRLSNYSDKVLFFPMDDFITSEALAVSPEFKAERINTLNKLVYNNNYIVVTNLMGILRYLPSKETWKESIIDLKVGEDYSREKLVEKLVQIGYERETIVSETGKLGVRGYVVDVFPIGYDNPVRIEFWGDTIDSIKLFNVDTQLTIDTIEKVTLFPFSEFLLDKDGIDGEIIYKQKYLKNYSDKVVNLGNYLDNYRCFFVDYNQILAGYSLLRKSIFEYNFSYGSDIDTNYMYNIEDINFEYSGYIMNVDNMLENVKLDNILKYKVNNIENFNDNLMNLSLELDKYLKNKWTVVICLDDKKTVDRLVKFLNREDIYVTSEEEILKDKINVIVKRIGNGFEYNNLVVIGEEDIFFRPEVKKKFVSSFKTGVKINSIDNISPGDYIVHEAHGIGIYDELCTLDKGGILKDYIKLRYAGGDVLYIPVEKIDRISKFSSRDGVTVKLDKLGTDNWQKKKIRVKKRLEDIAANLIKVSAEREAMKGFAFSQDDENQIMFDSQFDFQETPDQIKAIKQIKQEMELPKPMDMLLCGDVGYGKTEVAFRAMFKAVNDGKQVAYLCPTTVLSNQQYKNALSRFLSFPIKIALLNRFVDKSKQKEIIEEVNEGKVDILFGTHRILSKDIHFKDLGLLVIDEEQRFGVTHKEKIKELKATVDVLTLSATPIPRTLQMSMSGVRSLSLIETPPKERFPIQTYVLAENDNVVKDAIYKELSRNGQVFILYNSVEYIEKKVKEIREMVPEARIDFAHGRMTKDALENKMLDFIDHKYDILVCTTIIETGIDIPNVNTLIIYDADRFGLSQLYQIRGRIGRSNKIGYAYLMYDRYKVLNEVAVKRLNVIKEFTELGSGFKIAMRDLSIRGAGDMLGREQSGFIDQIGIDLYLKMLKEAVSKVKGDKEVSDDKEEVDDSKPLIQVNTHISDKYIDDNDLKIEIHKMINDIDSLDKLQEVRINLEDRFGKITKDMEIYMYEEWFEKVARKLKIVNIKQTKTFIEIELPLELSNKIDGEKLFMIANDVCNNFRFSYRLNHIYVILDIVNLDKHFIYYLVELLEKINNGEVVKE